LRFLDSSGDVGVSAKCSLGGLKDEAELVGAVKARGSLRCGVTAQTLHWGLAFP